VGTKYTSQSTSGYNSGNPPDDGTTGDNNKITWTGIRTSLADVLKLFSENIDTQIVNAVDVNTLDKSGDYSVLAADNGRTIECTSTPTITLGAAATMTTGYTVTVKCVSGTATVAVGGTDEVDGSASNRTLVAGNSNLHCEFRR
jgi:hypothetical protein